MVIMGTVLMLLLAVQLLPMACCARTGEGWDRYQPDIGQIHDARSLEAALYTSSNDGSGADADACVLLLHANGKVGCGEGGKNAKGPLLLVQESALHNARYYDLQNNVAVVVPAVDAGQLLIKLSTSNESLPPTVGAVLIEFSESFPGWNPAPQNPLDEYRPENIASGPGSVHDMTAVWNMAGLGLDDTSFPFAIFQLGNSTSAIARLRAQDNMNRLGRGLDPSKHDFHFVDIDVRMDAANSNSLAANSTNCIGDNTCLPLGGSSVLAALPPLRHKSIEASPDEKVILVVAQADAPPGLFHELAVGANAPLSGLVAVLAAARSLGRRIKRSPELSVRKQIVFAALRGESFGFMASRRLLWESYGFASSYHFNHTRPPLIFKQDTIDTVIEVGSVGQSHQTMRHALELFAHAHKAGSEVIDAMQQAATADQDHPVRLGLRPSDRYGVPPSSTWSFLRLNKSIPAIVLTEFDTSFVDPAYASPWDKNISVKAVATAALLLARTLESLALGADGPERVDIDGAVVEEDVAQLVDCFVVSGLEKCELSQQMMSLHREPAKSHYLGILRTVAKDPLISDSTVQTDLERFMWNYLALSTGNDTGKKCSRGNASLACGAGEQCVGYKSVENGALIAGTCTNSSVWYVASYSTALECMGCDGNATVNEFRWQVTDAAQTWEETYGWPTDPMWTESNWPLGVPQLVMYLREPQAREQYVLLAGTLITGFTLIVVVTLRYAWLKRLKQD